MMRLWLLGGWLVFDFGAIVGQLALPVFPSKELFLVEDVSFLLVAVVLVIRWQRAEQEKRSATYDQLTPYMRGLIAGHWTAADVVAAGWESAEACLANAEATHAGLLKRYHLLDKATMDYLDGMMAAECESLTVLIEERKQG